MPLNNPAPQFGLLTAYDMRAQSATKLFTRGSTAVNAPTFGTGEGVYEDAVFLLNGRTSNTTNAATNQLQNTKTFGSTWSASITSDDKIEIKANVQFTLTKTGSDDPLGFGSSTITASASGSDYVVVAPHDWSRGLLDLTDTTYRIDESGGANQFNFPAIKLQIQDVSVFIRDRASVSDADSFGLDSIEKLDQAALSNSNITWSITNDGYCRCYYLTSLGDITWNDSTTRETLGFTGLESPVADGVYSILTSTHKIAGVLIPSRPYQFHHLKVMNESQSKRKIGGGYVSNHIGSYVSSMLNFDLDGLLDLVDDYKHFSNRWLPLCSAGERVNFYQSWGDSRRALRTAEVTGTQYAYDDLYTSEDNGEYGRLRCSMITSEFELTYPNRLRRRVPVAMELEHL